MLKPYHSLVPYITRHTDPATFKALLRDYPEIDQKDACGIALLMYCVSAGHDEFTQLLLDMGANVNQRSDDNDTCLACAASTGYHSIVRLLLKYGADINAADQDEMTPLMLAACNNHLPCVEALLDNGADLKPCCREGRTVTDYATGAFLPLSVRVRIALLERRGVRNLHSSRHAPLTTEQALRKHLMSVLALANKKRHQSEADNQVAPQ